MLDVLLRGLAKDGNDSFRFCGTTVSVCDNPTPHKSRF
jgi:hypothetical protein